MGSNRLWLTAAAVGLGVMLVGWLIAPRAPQLAGATTGDPELAEAVREAVPDPTGYRSLAVALVDGHDVRFAGFGATADGDPVSERTPFEIGSVGKALTGMLLADLIDEGLVDPDETLRELLPGVEFESPEAGGITAAELASHRSGLPRIRVTGVGSALASVTRTLRGGDPYAGEDTAWLRASLPSLSRSDAEPEVNYSNYGYAVLGHALAERAGVAYPELLRQRILGPLGMTGTGLHLDGAALPAGRTAGTTAAGRPMDPWQGSGYAPAGIGIWSTATDLATLLAAVRSQAAPGSDAATPRFPDGADRRVGYGWFTSLVDWQEITWHNGGTGGFRSFIGFDRATGTGVVLLGDTDRPVEHLGLALLTGGDDAGRPPADPVQVGITLLFTLAGGVWLALAARVTRTDRLSLAATAAWAVALPVAAYRLGQWQVVPPAVWGVGLGLTAAGLVLATFRWPTVPSHRGRFRVAGWLSAAVSVTVAAGFAGWVYAPGFAG